MSTTKDIVIARIDATRYEGIGGHKIKGYPTLKFYPKVGDYCMRLSASRVSHSMAQSTCEEDGATLAVIDGEGNNDALVEVLRDRKIKYVLNRILIIKSY